MAQRGFKPTVIKNLEGSNYKKKERAKEPMPQPKVGQKPRGMDAYAKKMWNRLVPKLERLGLATELDHHNLQYLCQTGSRIDQVRKEIKKLEKLYYVQVTEDKLGNKKINMKINPLIVLEKQLFQIFRHLAKDFGLTPAGRIGLKVDTKDDSGEDLLS